MMDSISYRFIIDSYIIMMDPSDSSWFITQISLYFSTFSSIFPMSQWNTKSCDIDEFHQRFHPRFRWILSSQIVGSAPLPLREEVLYNPSASSPGLASYVCAASMAMAEKSAEKKRFRLNRSWLCVSYVCCHHLSSVFVRVHALPFDNFGGSILWHRKTKKSSDFLKLKHRNVHFLQLSVHCTTLESRTTGVVTPRSWHVMATSGLAFPAFHEEFIAAVDTHLIEVTTVAKGVNVMMSLQAEFGIANTKCDGLRCLSDITEVKGIGIPQVLPTARDQWHTRCPDLQPRSDRFP